MMLVVVLLASEVLRLRLWLAVALLGSGRVVLALVLSSDLVQPGGREV